MKITYPRNGKLYLAALVAFTLLVSACYKPMNLTKHPIPAGVVVLEFAVPVRYVIDLKIDGKDVPVKYIRKNRRLWIEGLSPGTHNINVHSVSYVFGPEFENFTLDEKAGIYFFIQSRKYRSAIPKDRARTSIRAYRKKLRKEGVDVNEKAGGKIRAYFKR